MPFAATSERAYSNYREALTHAGTLEEARTHVELSDLRSGDHVFLYNPDQDRGYLLSDLDRDNYNYFETGITLLGAGSATDMNWSNII